MQYYDGYKELSLEDIHSRGITQSFELFGIYPLVRPGTEYNHYTHYLVPGVAIFNNISKQYEQPWVAVPYEHELIDQARADALAAINTEYERRANQVRVDTPDNEVLTWDIQKLEAEAWQNNSATDTPFVDKLAVARGVDRDELIAKVLAKVTAYREYVGTLTGIRQRLEDQVKAAETVEDVRSVVWPE